MICEDYERDPPFERRKYKTDFSASSIVRPRRLTQAESTLASKYDGGKCWIKVTFDSEEAAERAIYHSPHFIQGHWIYAKPYLGRGPDIDAPLISRIPEKTLNISSNGQAIRRASQTLGPSFAQKNNAYSNGAAATLPRSFTSATTSQANCQVSRSSSSTASSATATAPEASYPDLHNRPASSTPQASTRNPDFYTHFPDIPRAVLRPAHEAFLPQPTWFESFIARLSAAGWLPGDMIGDGVPILDNGDFDWANASLYWKACYWIDCKFGFDLCGLKDD